MKSSLSTLFAMLVGTVGLSVPWIIRIAVESSPVVTTTLTQSSQGQYIVNLAPHARILPLPGTISVGQECKLQCVGTDPDPGDLVYYRWIQLDGVPVSPIGGWTNSYLRFIPAASGVYSFRVYVRDYHGAVAITDVEVSVVP